MRRPTTYQNLFHYACIFSESLLSLFLFFQKSAFVIHSTQTTTFITSLCITVNIFIALYVLDAKMYHKSLLLITFFWCRVICMLFKEKKNVTKSLFTWPYFVAALLQFVVLLSDKMESICLLKLFSHPFSQIVSLAVLSRMTVWLSKRSTYKWLSAIFHWIYVIWFISCLLSHYHMLWSLAHATLVWASYVKDEISCHKIYLVIFDIKRKKEEAFLVDEGMKRFGADFWLNAMSKP